MLNLYKKACEMRTWKTENEREIKETVRAKLTEEYRTEYKEKNPSAKELPQRLSAEHSSVVEERVEKQS